MDGINNVTYCSQYSNVDKADANRHSCIFVNDNYGQEPTLSIVTTSGKCIVHCEMTETQLDELIQKCLDVKAKLNS